VGELGALAAICAYVLAVGAQPSVIRAGIAGALGSIAWLLARERDRWWFLLVGAFVLLAWNPYTLFDAGFQLSFAAVVAIFTIAPAAAAALTWFAGWCAAYLAFCARLIGGLPFAQIRSGWAAAAVGLCAALAGAYAWRRCRMPS